MANSHGYGKTGNFTLLLTSTGQEWQFHTATDTYRSRMAISHCYWHLVVKNANFTLQFHIATHIYWSRMAISNIATDISRMALKHCYWHLVVENGNVTLLLTSTGQEWQFHRYWCLVQVKNGNFTLLLTHLVVKNGNFTLLLTSSGQVMAISTLTTDIWNWHFGQEWQFHIATDI